MYLNKSYYIYIVNDKICSSRLAKQDFFIYWWYKLGGGQNGQRTVNFVFYTEFLISRFEACLFEVQKTLQMPANSNKKWNCNKP